MPKLNMTQGRVDRAICLKGNSKTDYFDIKTTGLVLTVSSAGKKTYSIRAKNTQGRVIQRKIADASVVQLVEVKKIAIKLLTDLAKGIDPFEQKPMSPKLMDFSNDYLDFVKSYKRSWQTDESLLRNHINPAFGRKHMDQITKHEIITFCAKHRKTHAPGSVNRLLIILRYMFNLALKWEVTGIIKNPTAGIPMFEENNKLERFLTKEEVFRLYEIVRQSDNTMLKFIIPMLILTGARKREVLDAKWEDFDVEKRSWRIPITKAGKPRHVPLSDGALQILAAVHNDRKQWPPNRKTTPWVFANPKTAKPYVSIFYAWNTARKKAGLPDVRIHDLRHSFASFLINNGRSLYEVQKILGHTQIITTQRYAHLTQDTLLEAANTATQALNGLVKSDVLYLPEQQTT